MASRGVEMTFSSSLATPYGVPTNVLNCYHANGHGATINDPRYPRMFVQAREEFPNTNVDRVDPDNEGNERD